jgi:Mg-chelatase subunit ChlD
MRLVTCALVGLLPLTSIVAANVRHEAPAVDVVFCIDCSGSMGGVIETAKQKVWAIVNEIAKAKPTPVLKIGLIGYGNASGPFRTFPLSDDLDEVYKNLMTFKDEGWGDEYVGLAIARATQDMQWSPGKQTLRVIYVVGNETARQGPDEFDYTKTAPAAIAKEIVVNAIYCGDQYGESKPTWRELAKLADGQYMEIAGQGGAIVMASPFDDELAKLNTALNATYLAYGSRAQYAAQNQAVQDGNAARLGVAVAADRAVAKAGTGYQNAGWDLVDASKQEDFDISKLKDEELPETLQKIEPAKRAEFIKETAAKRAEVQKQIAEVAGKRNAFLQEEIKKQGLTSDKAFDEAVKKSLVEQAKKKGFEFEEQR